MIERYLTAPSSSADATRLVTSIGRRVRSKIPVAGLTVTATGIGYDRSPRKAAGKAIISGVGGAPSATGTAALIGAAMPAMQVGAVSRRSGILSLRIRG